MKLKLSASALSVFKDCPRCFWLTKNAKVKQPRGVFPSLPGGMDSVLKFRYDSFRAAGTLPPEIAERLPKPFHLYEDLRNLKVWRNWRQGLNTEVDGIALGGAIDDMVCFGDGTVSPFDYKTRGSAPKEGGSEQYYGHQLDIYALLFKDNGLKPNGRGYLAYYFPSDSMAEPSDKPIGGEISLDGVAVDFKFQCEIVVLEAIPERAADLVRAAAACLAGDMPQPGSNAYGGCPYCEYVDGMKQLEAAAAR